MINMNSESNDYKHLWNSAIKFVKDKGYKDEIKLKFRQSETEDEFLADYVWVVFASGFRVKILEMKWQKIKRAFFNFKVKEIVKTFEKDSSYFEKKVMPINNKRKIRAIVKTAMTIEKEGYKKFLDIEKMTELPFIGNITKFHLARNLGLQTGKPDRWMVRLAEKLGFPSTVDGAQNMLEKFHSVTGIKIGIIDLVLWRACEQGWLDTFK